MNLGYTTTIERENKQGQMGRHGGGRGAIGTKEITIRGARNSLKNLNKISEKTNKGNKEERDNGKYKTHAMQRRYDGDEPCIPKTTRERRGSIHGCAPAR